MEKITACPNCGSIHLEMITGAENAILDRMGASSISVFRCADCGRNVLPIEFRSEKEHQRFAKSLRGRKSRPVEAEVPARNESDDVGVDFSRGYAAYASLCFVIVGAVLLSFAVANGSLLSSNGLFALAFFGLAAYFYPRGRKGK